MVIMVFEVIRRGIYQKKPFNTMGLRVIPPLFLRTRTDAADHCL